MAFNAEQILELTQARFVGRGQGLALLDSVDQVSIAWTVPHGSVQDIVDFVQKKRLSYKDVAIERQTLNGLWRSVGWETQQTPKKDTTQILFVQTLRRGYAEQPYDTEAFIDSGKRSQGLEDLEYNVVWPNIRPQKVQDVKNTIIARGSDSNPTFGKTSLTGKYVYSAVQNKAIDSDGAHNVTCVLKKVATISATPVDDLKDLNYNVRKINTILSPNHHENGLGRDWTFTWTGLDPSSESTLQGLRDSLSGFVTNVVGETVNSWAGTTVVGSLYSWSASGDDNWGRKRDMVVYCRKVFDADTVGTQTAIEKGYVTESWEMLPVQTDVMDDNTLTLTVKMIDNFWKNIEFDGEDEPLPDRVKVARANPAGNEGSNVMIASGIPANLAEKLVDEMDPESGHLISKITVTQDQNNQAVIEKSEVVLQDYIHTVVEEDVLYDPPVVVTYYRDSGTASKQVSIWPHVDPDEATAHESLLLGSGENSLWTSDDLDSDDFVKSQFRKDKDPEGSYTYTLYTKNTSSDDATLFFTQGPLYESRRMTKNENGKSYFADVLLQYKVKKGIGVPSGWSSYSAAETNDVPTGENPYPGWAMLPWSSFRELGNDWYFYKKIYQMCQFLEWDGEKYVRPTASDDGMIMSISPYNSGNGDTSVYPDGTDGPKEIIWTEITTEKE